ncbi:hypothetical protein EKE94_01115 [Mesobaculum littorinae]|uniref:DUF4398 domain-containing protein n=1 Tax=Mesobaculum littorinae TaxID=2486419 RepID=A0A438AL72_9RHOB|nr:hypothetical protein [Mesobaculum littorinae]RVV99326.1 hypothetical protein EKE94_01115 [Mesobaculum littorinae]
MLRPLALGLLALSACAAPPDLSATDTAAASRAPYPRLLPLGEATAAANAAPRFPPEEAAQLARRAGAIGTPPASGTGDLAERARLLRERAAALRDRQIADQTFPSGS